MKLISKALLLAAAAALVAGCSGVNMNQFKQPKQTAKIVATTSFRPDAANSAECGEPYDDNDTYPNVTEYFDSYGNPLLKIWSHPGGTPYLYARYYYSNHAYGQLEKVVRYQPPYKPKVAKFTRSSEGAVIGVSETIILPDQVFEKKEVVKETPAKETVTTDTKTTVTEKQPIDGGKVQITYETEREDAVREVGTKIVDQNTGVVTMHSETLIDKGEVKREFGKKYEYTPDGKVSRIVNHEGESTGYYCWEYDDHGNWTGYKFYREPSDGKEYSQTKEYTYNERGDWTRCATSVNGVPEAIVLRTFEYLDK